MSTTEGSHPVGGGTRSPRILPPAAITAICFAVAVIAALAVAVAAVHDRARPFPHPVVFVVLTLLLAYTHIRPVRVVQRHGGVESDYMDEAVFAPMVLLLAPLEVALATVAATLVGNVIARRPPTKTMFNVGQTVLAFLAGYVVARPGINSPHGSVMMLALVLGAAVTAFYSSFAVAVILRLSVGPSVLRTAIDQWRIRLLPSTGAILLGVVAAVAVRHHPAAAIPAIGLGLTMQRAYVATLVQRQGRLAAEALQSAVIAIRNSAGLEELREHVLATAPQILHARRVQFVSPDAPRPRGAIEAAIDDDTVLQVSKRIGGGPWLDSERSSLSTLASTCGAALRNARLLAHMSAITDSQREGVLTIDTAGVVSFANPAARRLTHNDDLLGRVADEVFGIELGDGTRVDLTDLAASHRGLRDSDSILISGTDRVPVAFTATGLVGSENGVVLVIHDNTERKAFEEKLTYLAFHDPLTYLPNRRLFEDRLDHALVRTERHETRHALLMIDLDRFKLVNDSYGHPAGDSLLVQVAGVLRRALRRQDTCARLGGDEFAILLEDIDHIGHATEVAQRILDSLADGCVVNGHELFVSASIGIATSDQTNIREELVAAADAAAYAAKSAGKGRFEVFAPDASENPRARLEMESSLRRALENDELELHYQPLVDAGTGEPVAAEALVRWRSPEGLMAPYRFIPLAEETGLIVPLGAWVLEEACRQAHAWTSAHPDRVPLEISVNLSAIQLARPTLVGDVAEILERTGLPPAQLCLEITETVIMRDVEAAITTLRELKELGVQVAIDDFGTGYSSLSYLKQFPVDVVKVDRVFLAGLGESPVDTEIVSAVVRLAAVCGITAVAEGVETEEQLALLTELGCPLVQGFLTSKPLPAEEFERYWHDTAPRLVPAARRADLTPTP